MPGALSNEVLASSPPQYRASCDYCQIQWTFSNPPSPPAPKFNPNYREYKEEG